MGSYPVYNLRYPCKPEKTCDAYERTNSLIISLRACKEYIDVCYDGVNELGQYTFNVFRIIKVIIPVIKARHPLGKAVGKIMQHPSAPGILGCYLKLLYSGTQVELSRLIINNEDNPLCPRKPLLPGYGDVPLIFF